MLPACGPSAAFQAGKEAYDRGDYATTLKEWRPLAEQGDAAAAFFDNLVRGKGKSLRAPDSQDLASLLYEIYTTIPHRFAD